MEKFLSKLPQYWKTVMAVITALGVIGTQVIEALSHEDWTKVTAPGAVSKILITVLGIILVYKKKNLPEIGKPPDPDKSVVDDPQ